MPLLGNYSIQRVSWVCNHWKLRLPSTPVVRINGITGLCFSQLAVHGIRNLLLSIITNHSIDNTVVVMTRWGSAAFCFIFSDNLGEALEVDDTATCPFSFVNDHRMMSAVRTPFKKSLVTGSSLLRHITTMTHLACWPAGPLWVCIMVVTCCNVFKAPGQWAMYQKAVTGRGIPIDVNAPPTFSIAPPRFPRVIGSSSLSNRTLLPGTPTR